MGGGVDVIPGGEQKALVDTLYVVEARCLGTGKRGIPRTRLAATNHLFSILSL